MKQLMLYALLTLTSLTAYPMEEECNNYNDEIEEGDYLDSDVDSDEMLHIVGNGKEEIPYIQANPDGLKRVQFQNKESQDKIYKKNIKKMDKMYNRTSYPLLLACVAGGLWTMATSRHPNDHNTTIDPQFWPGLLSTISSFALLVAKGLQDFTT